MKNTRRQHSATFKSKVALEALKEQKTLSQICEQYTLHANQICDWKKQIIEQAPLIFERKQAKESMDTEALTAPLYQQIGQLKVELDFLKKKLKQLGHPQG